MSLSGYAELCTVTIILEHFSKPPVKSTHTDRCRVLSPSDPQRNRFPFSLESPPSITFLRANLVLNQGASLTDAESRPSAQTAGLPASTGKTECEAWHGEAPPAQGPYQLPEALVFAWTLTAQNICQHAVHLAHVQPDPVKEVEEKRAGWGKRGGLPSHTRPQLHGQRAPPSHRTGELRRKRFLPPT